MKRVAAGVVALVVSLWTTVYWVEAEKEIVVLCGLSRVGTPVGEVQRLHGTASLATLRVDSATTRRTTQMSSARNLSLTSCRVVLTDSTVSDSEYDERLRLAPLVGLRRSLGVEDRVPAAALEGVAPQSIVGEVIVGTVLLLCLGAFVAALGLATQRHRWAKAIVLLLLIDVGVILLIGS